MWSPELTVEEQFTKPQLQSVKSALHREKCQANTAKVEQVKGEISSTLQRAMDLGTEKGASTWLTALPLQEQSFTLNKQEFQMRYIFGMDGN